MVDFRPFRFFYPLFRTIHIFCTFSPYTQWALAISIFFQYFFLEVYSVKPSAYFSESNERNVFINILSICYFLPWIFGTDSMCYDSVIWLIFNLIFIIFTIILTYRCSKGHFIPHFSFFYIKYYFQFIQPIFSIPLFFRISYSIERLINNRSKENIASFIILLINLLIYIFGQFISSVFLLPFLFIIRSKLDVYDGTTHLFLYITQIIYCISFILIPVWSSIPLSGLFLLLYFFILVILLYYRLVTTVHVSLVAQYLELSPLFCLPFMVIYHLYFAKFHFFYTFIYLLFFHILFIVIINFVRKQLKRNCLHLFESFIYEDSTTEQELPPFVLGNISSSIRLIAYYNSDPSVLNRFLENQKQIHLRTSVFIEICRFLSIFKEYRQMMLDEISYFSPKSVYNNFILHMFQYLLEQQNMTKVPEFYKNRLDYFYRGFATHSYFYWKARKEKKFVRAFFESYTCAFFVNDWKYMISGLFYLYPFVPILHKYLADLLLDTDGDFEGYKKEMKVYFSLEKKQSVVFDPFLQVNAMMNPKILQFCNQKSHAMFNISSASSAMNTVNLTKTRSYSLFQTKRKKEVKPDKKTVASKIIRSERKIPYLHYLLFILPALISFGFVVSTSQNFKLYMENWKDYIESINLVQHSFYSVISSIFIPFALPDFSNFNKSDIIECQKAFSLIPMYINQYYLNLQILSNQSNFLLILTFHEIGDLVMKSDDVCDIVVNFSDFMSKNTFNNINLIFKENRNYLEYLGKVLQSTDEVYHFKSFLLYGSIILIIFLIIYFIVACITLNKIMSKNVKAIDFLSSEKRISSVLQEPESRESLWDQLAGFDPSFVFSDYSFNFDSDEDNDPFATTALSTTHLSTINFSTTTVSSANQTIQTAASSIKHVKNANFQTNNENIDPNTNQNLNEKIIPSSFNETENNSMNEMNSKLIVPDDIEIHIENDNDDQLNSIIPELNSTMIQIDNHHHGFKIENNDFDLNELMVYLKCKEKEIRFFSFLSILMILCPCLFFYLMALIAYHPLNERKKNEYQYGKRVFSIVNDFKNAMTLVNEMLYLYKKGQLNVTNLELIDNIYESHIMPHWHLYFEEKCYNDDEMNCYSIHSIVQLLQAQNITKEFIEVYALPILVSFAENSMKVFFNESIEGSSSVQSAKIPFAFICLIVVLSIFVGGYFKTASLKRSMNSLFHFPRYESNQNSEQHAYNNEAKDSLNSKEANSSLNSKEANENVGSKGSSLYKNSANSRDSLDSNNSLAFDIKLDSNLSKDANNNGLNNDEDVSRFPSNVIIITSVTETDEIYSISETCHKLINKKSSDLICRRLSKLFPCTSKRRDFEIREFNGKTFISKTKSIGKLSKTVLIEAAKFESKIKTATITQKLINFFPNYFAKPFSEEFTNIFHFKQSLLIFIRIDSSTDQIDNFFNIINRLDQTFYNIDFIRSNGSVLTCICREPDELEIILYLRDLISSCEENSKRQVNNFSLKSVFIDFIDELNAEVVEGDIEPEISFEEKDFFISENLTFFVDDHCIGFSEESFSILGDFSKLNIHTKILYGKKVTLIPFKVFSKEVVNNL